MLCPSQNFPNTRQRIKDLAAQLADSQLKAQFFEAVVNVLAADDGAHHKKAESAVIQEKRVSALSFTQACTFLGITRQAYYKRCLAMDKRDKHELLILDFVMAERLLPPRPRIGTSKLQHLMSLQLLFFGLDHLFTLLTLHCL